MFALLSLTKLCKDDADVRCSDDRLELRLGVPSSCQLSTFYVQSQPVQAKPELSFASYLANAKSTQFTHAHSLVVLL